MFGDVAVRLLNMMGHSGTVPGALLAEDVPQALSRLQTAIEAVKQSSEAQNSEDEDGEPAIGLPSRALPLVELLKAAAISDCNVMWTSGK